MKKISFTEQRIILFFVLFVFAFSSCRKEEDVKQASFDAGLHRVDLINSQSGINCINITVGQNINAGNVCIIDIDTDNDDCTDALEITITTTDGWEILESHFALAADLSGIPVNNAGNPVPGQFPFHSGQLDGVTTYTYTIPFSHPLINFDCPGCTGPEESYYAALHLSLRKLLPGGDYQTETGWANGPKIKQKGSWGMYFALFISCDETTTQSNDPCGTAYAYGNGEATCFMDIPGLNSNNWGWTNGPLAFGNYSFPLYRGAAQCDLNNGEIVGNLTVDYNGSDAIITYTADAGYTFSEVQIYVGNAQLPLHNGSPTTAPGLYSHVSSSLNDATSYTHTFTGLSGQIYVIAHAVTCGGQLQ